MSKINHKIKLTISHIRDLTIEYGENWGYSHVCRVLALIEMIGADLDYDQDVVIYATYLHDWGAFPKYSQQGVEHALRSVQVAEAEILPYTTLSPDARRAVVQAIGLHDYRDDRPTPTVEAGLLREADMLDMLGVIGMARDFARGPKDLRAALNRIEARRAKIAGKFTLPKAKTIAGDRLAEMDRVIELIKAESFGHL